MKVLTSPYRAGRARPSCGALALVVASLLATPALAAPNDIHLPGLLDPTTKAPRNADFRLLTQELALVITPMALQPAETTGQSGFDFGVDYAIHDIREGQPYWRDAVEGKLEGRTLLPVLQTLGFRGRKGFILPVPLTSEIEVSGTWLADSSLWSLGSNIRLALNEGFRWIPDIAVMAGANTMIGADDLQLVTATVGGSISKGFGIMGSWNLCPFVSYQSIFMHAWTKVIDPDPSSTSDVGQNVVFDEVSILNTENRMDRISVGARMHIAIVQLSAGVDFNLIPEGTGQRRLFMQYGARAGLLF